MMTTAGIYGFVTAIEDDVIWLEIAEGVDIRIARQAVSRRDPGREAPSQTAPAADGRAAEADEDDEQDADSASANGTKGERDAPSAD